MWIIQQRIVIQCSKSTKWISLFGVILEEATLNLEQEVVVKSPMVFPMTLCNVHELGTNGIMGNHSIEEWYAIVNRIGRFWRQSDLIFWQVIMVCWLAVLFILVMYMSSESYVFRFLDSPSDLMFINSKHITVELIGLKFFYRSKTVQIIIF